MSRDTSHLPQRVGWLWWGFRRYALRFVRKHFHAVRRLSATPVLAVEELGDRPLLIFLNHPSWWDPMMSLAVMEATWPEREHYAPISESMLAEYKVFGKLGFFGVDQENKRRGAVQLLRTGQAIFEQRNTGLWLTAEGEFRDVRRRPIVLEGGLAALASRAADAVVLPLAVEYVFWTERTPEALYAWGEPTFLEKLTDAERETTALQKRFETQLGDTLDQLAAAAMARDPAAFVDVLGGRAGTGGFYGFWQRLTGRGGAHAEVMAEAKTARAKP